MAALAERLMVGRIPEEPLISAVRDDMVNDLRRDGDIPVKPKQIFAERMLRKVACAIPLPRRVVTPLGSSFSSL